jgi:hypothetical protein
MTNKRDIARSEARQRRAQAKDEACRTASLTRERVASAVSRARLVLTDENFVGFLRMQGIQSLPRLLATHESPPQKTNAKSEPGGGRIGDGTLDFVMTWTFFFPLFANPTVAAHLEEAWPGFISELKDAFISQVVEGPLPQ